MFIELLGIFKVLCMIILILIAAVVATFLLACVLIILQAAVRNLRGGKKR